MIELFRKGDNSLKQSFAGDIFNSSVYLKRTFPDIQVSFASAIGIDGYSEQMMALFKCEDIETEFVYRSETKIPGLYAIQTDAQGERSFTYWRSDSAARQVMSYVDSDEIQKLSQQNMFFFSGISLAVVHPDQRVNFWKMVEQLKQAGVEIVFDPNYRARMWDSPEDAKQAFEKALHLADICLPGVDDFEQLYGHRDSLDVVEFCEPFGIRELVIKNGEQGIFCIIDGKPLHFDIDPVSNVVDTTSAGDSFNGVYLGARLKGFNPSYAVELASKAAAEVIQHQGAIIPAGDFQQFVNGLSLTESSNTIRI